MPFGDLREFRPVFADGGESPAASRCRLGLSVEVVHGFANERRDRDTAGIRKSSELRRLLFVELDLHAYHDVIISDQMPSWWGTDKVVKTTQFGAFVELKKGTDGLLHVSNVGPGRVAHIEDVMSRGDIVDVLVQEVDKARGRIGLKLVHKHEDGRLVEPEELIERAKSAPPRPPEEERPRRDGDRGRGGRDRGPRRD
jgi:predicted RNA-binding protein with RPS1 domain